MHYIPANLPSKVFYFSSVLSCLFANDVCPGSPVGWGEVLFQCQQWQQINQ